MIVLFRSNIDNPQRTDFFINTRVFSISIANTFSMKNFVV